MHRKEFLQFLALAALTGASRSFGGQPMNSALNALNEKPRRGGKLPALFTSHGNPFDIIVPREKHAFWNRLFSLGKTLRAKQDIEAVLVVSAHWCTDTTLVNIAPNQEQIYDYYGFPKEYYEVQYHAKGSPAVAKTVKPLVPTATETTEWGLDHGAWPILMHLFPDGDMPVFQMSIDYDAKPEYHFELGKQLRPLRERGVLIIGSGAIVHNIPLAMHRFQSGNKSPYGWEAEYDAWFKKQLDARNTKALIDYTTSHPLASKAAPTPDHYVPALYTLGLMDSKDEIEHFHDAIGSMPAFSERSFMLS
jgi:4,5-DOPA dioxygenase extradiol